MKKVIKLAETVERQRAASQDRTQKTEAIVGDTSLKCWYTNACSLVNKMSELRERVQNEVYDIIGISETWANDLWIQYVKKRQKRMQGWWTDPVHKQQSTSIHQ